MRILIATDGSDFSKAAIEKCCQIITKPEEAAIKIVSVYQVVVPLDIHTASIEYSQELEEATRRQAEEFVKEAAAAVRECFPNSNIEITTQVSVGAGGITGGLIGALIGTGIPEETVQHYETGLREGGIVLGFRPRNAVEANEVESVW